MENNNSHKQILKSTGIIGGSQIISIIISVLRTKVAAILLGPSGIGIIGILQSATDLVRNATGFGINFSGVKDIAEAFSSGEQQRINRTITIVRHWALWTGILGMLVTIFLCIPLSNYSFGNDSFALGIAILSITLLITSVSAGQLALLQGLRKIDQLAKATLLGSILGIVITLPLYWWLGKKGIIPGMIITTLGGFLVSLYYSRKITVNNPKLSLKETFMGGLNMAKLGFFIVASAFIADLTFYLTRIFILSKLNLDSVGHFQASWTISKLYIGIVLNAMLADFFPRLTAINYSNQASNKLINEQLEMTFLIGFPLILALCAYANIAIYIIYSSSFSASISLLQWQMYGSFFTLVSWPLGIMFLAKGKGLYVIIINFTWSVVFYTCLYFGWTFWGFNVFGIAFFIASVVNMVAIIFSVRKLTQFSFSKINRLYIVCGLIAISTVFVNISYNSGVFQYTISTIILMASMGFSINKLSKIINIKKIIKSLF